MNGKLFLLKMVVEAKLVIDHKLSSFGRYLFMNNMQLLSVGVLPLHIWNILWQSLEPLLNLTRYF